MGTSTSTNAHITALADAVETAFRQPKTIPVVRPNVQTLVYRTKGGTVIVASSGRTTDNGQPRDLMAVTFSGQVTPLYIATNPDVVADLYFELQKRAEAGTR